MQNILAAAALAVAVMTISGGNAWLMIAFYWLAVSVYWLRNGGDGE